MSEHGNNQKTPALDKASADTAQLIYILYLSSLALFVIPAIIGVIWAFVNKNDASDWLKTHYVFLIHTFWKGLLYLVLGLLLSLVLIGLLIFPLLIIWWVIRCFEGLKALGRQEAIEEPERWFF